MKPADAFKIALNMTDYILTKYLAEFSDAELLVRPGKDCNHIAWQLGHLIQSEQGIVNQIRPGSGIELPAGFKEAHSKENASCDDAGKFLTKQQYLDLYTKSRKNIKTILADMSDDEFDKPSPKGWDQFPNVGAMMNLIVNHPMMHVGQFVVVRRLLGKPIVV
ncbi:MAG: DinB family protein [Gemmatales bacterium]